MQQVHKPDNAEQKNCPLTAKSREVTTDKPKHWGLWRGVTLQDQILIPSFAKRQIEN
nr:MAG TPA: hypothetical protein [Caudoviricetes sp.]